MPSNELEKDPVSSLYYSPQKLQSIKSFREAAGLNGQFTGERILDLSFWHPGAILYLGGLQFPHVVNNKVFRKTLYLQVEATIKQVQNLESSKTPPMIIETVKSGVIDGCSDLSDFVEDTELRFLLKSLEFNPRVLNKAIYISDPVDLTLYPKNIAYLVPCPTT